jgi:hypothetical protein
MAIKVTTGQQTFIKKIVIGTPISTAQSDLSADNVSYFVLTLKSEKLSIDKSLCAVDIGVPMTIFLIKVC